MQQLKQLTGAMNCEKYDSYYFYNAVVFRANTLGRSHINVDFHRTGHLPCVKIEVGSLMQ